MDNELHKIINGLEASSFERGMHKGYVLGVIKTIRSVQIGKSNQDIIEEMILEIPHLDIRETIDSMENVDGGMGGIISKIDELITE